MKKITLVLTIMLFSVLSLWGTDTTTIFEITSYDELPSGWTGTASTGSYLKLAPGDLITASLDLDAYTAITLTCDVATFGGGTDNPLEISVSTDDGLSWTAQNFTSNTPSSSTYIDGGTFALTNVSATTKIKFECTSGAKGIRLMNIKLVGILDENAPKKPSFENVLPIEGSSFEAGSAITVSASVTTDDLGGVDSVRLAFGDAPDALNDTVTMIRVLSVFSYVIISDELGPKYGQLIAYANNGEISKTSVIEVFSVCPLVTTPVAAAASDVMTNSFTANWNAVAEAEDYLLYVWTEMPATVVASDLFISAYVEGSSNNKYIAIYNGTGGDVDLSSYSVAVYSNGDTTLSNEGVLSGILQNNNTLVLANSSATIYAGDVLESSAVNFNGDDIFVLRKDDENIDAAGPLGNANNNNYAEDVSLYRLASVSAPDTMYDASQWLTKEKDYIDSLGMHAMDGSSSVNYILDGDSVFAASNAAVTGLESGMTYKYAVKALNMYACESELSDTITVSTGIPTELSQTIDKHINVYAASGFVNVETVGLVSVGIYDIMGREVEKSLVHTKGSFALKQGIYLVRVDDTVTKVLVR